MIRLERQRFPRHDSTAGNPAGTIPEGESIPLKRQRYPHGMPWWFSIRKEAEKKDYTEGMQDQTSHVTLPLI